MRLLHYLELENFKRFGERERIELDHPAVLIGPNNCGKTTAMQAIALWSQAVGTWYEAKGKAPPKERTSTSLNRLNLVAVPTKRTRYLWHNTAVRAGNSDIHVSITLGVLHDNVVKPVTMRFRNQGDELVYCTPDEATLRTPEAIEAAAKINVELLYPMSGLETEEPVLQPGRIDVLLGQGQTAQVLRNLCLLVAKESPDEWHKIVALMKRLFAVDLGTPAETARGSIDLYYRQEGVREELDVALSGRGFQQMLLIFAYLYSHRKSVLLIDEPDAHLEILRQKQVYVKLREIAAENESQVVLVTHSEIILDEALDTNLTLLLGGKAENLADKTTIKTALKHYGADHYVRALQRGYVLYVEGTTDVDILRSLARRIHHPAATEWDERINVFYVQDNYPSANGDTELERVEGGFGVTPREHFGALRGLIPELQGVAILDSDGQRRSADSGGGLDVLYWERYEAENYFVTPSVLLAFVSNAYATAPLFDRFNPEAEEVLHDLIHEMVFGGKDEDYEVWAESAADARRLIWNAQTKTVKMSAFAEEYFRRLASRLGHAMLLRKSDLYRLIDFIEPTDVPQEVSSKLDSLVALFRASATRGAEAE